MPSALSNNFDSFTYLFSELCSMWFLYCWYYEFAQEDDYGVLASPIVEASLVAARLRPSVRHAKGYVHSLFKKCVEVYVFMITSCMSR